MAEMEQEDSKEFWENAKIDQLELEEMLFQMEFPEMQRYAEAVEALLVEHAKKTEQNIPMPNRKMSEEEKYNLDAKYASDMDEIERVFPKILRYSLFVYSYSFFEHALLRLAENYRRDRNLVLLPSDLKHRGIEQAHVYLKKVVSVPFPDTGSTWQDITVLNSIRNLIVHNEGNLPKKNNKDRKSVEAFAKKWHDDFSTDYNEIELHKTFLFRVLDTFRIFSNELFTGLRGSSGTEGVV